MESVVWPLVGVVLVTFLPGLLLHRILGGGAPVLDQIAVAPALTFGIFFVVFQTLGFVNIPVTGTVFMAVAGLLAAAAFALILHRRSRSVTSLRLASERHGDRDLERSGGLVLLVLAVSIGLTLWLSSVAGDVAVPPNHDSMNHGFMAARIAATDSVDADDVTATSLRISAGSFSFYPLGIHIAAALIHDTTGASISDILWWLVVLAAAVWFPLGIFCLARRLFADDSLLPGGAALLSIGVPFFPYKPIAWGGIALIVGTALVASVVTTLSRLLVSGWSPASAVLAVVGLAGLVFVHTSEVPTALLLLGVAALDLLRRGATIESVRTMAARLAIIGGLLTVLSWPVLSDLSRPNDMSNTPTATLWPALLDLAHLRVASPLSQWRVTLAAIAGGVLLLRRGRPWLMVGLVTFGALYGIAAVSSEPALRALTSPWYRQAERVAYNVVLFAVLLGAVALAAAARATTHRMSPDGRRSIAASLIVGAAALVVVGDAPIRTSEVLRREISLFSPIGTNEVTAFRWLATHADDQLAVLGQGRDDGATWMYAFSRLESVFGVKPHDGTTLSGTWDERLYLVRHLFDTEARPEVERLLGKYCVGYVYYGERLFHGATRVLDLAALERDVRFHKAFRAGGTVVFEVKDPYCTQARV